MATTRRRRPSGSGSRLPAAPKSAPASSNRKILIVAGVVVVAAVAGGAFALEGGSATAPGSPSGPASPAASSATPGDDPFASVARADKDLGGDDVATMDEDVGSDAFTIAFPKFFSVRGFKTLSEGKCVKLAGPEKSAFVWVVGAMKGLVSTRDLLAEANLQDAPHSPAQPASQRLGSVTGTGEKLTLQLEPEPLAALVLRAPLGADREVVALAIAPERNARLRSVVDAMLGSLRAAALQGARAVGGVTYLPRS